MKLTEPYYVKEKVVFFKEDIANKLMNMVYPKELQDLDLYPKKTGAKL